MRGTFSKLLPRIVSIITTKPKNPDTLTGIRIFAAQMGLEDQNASVRWTLAQQAVFPLIPYNSFLLEMNWQRVPSLAPQNDRDASLMKNNTPGSKPVVVLYKFSGEHITVVEMKH